MPITVKDNGPIRIIEINRPEKANALLAEDTIAIKAAVASAPEDCGALVFHGSGKRNFSAGMDLNTFQGVSETEAFEIISNVGEMIRVVRHAPQVSIAAISGACIGAAFELVLATDIRVAHSSARVGLPEVKLGIPSVVDAAQLHNFVGLSLAKEMLLLGHLKTIDELQHTGFANRLVEQPEVLDVALQVADEIVKLPRIAVCEQRRLIDDWLNTPLQVAVDQSKAVFSRMFRDPNTTKAVAEYASRH